MSENSLVKILKGLFFVVPFAFEVVVGSKLSTFVPGKEGFSLPKFLWVVLFLTITVTTIVSTSSVALLYKQNAELRASKKELERNSKDTLEKHEEFLAEYNKVRANYHDLFQSCVSKNIDPKLYEPLLGRDYNGKVKKP